MLARRRLWHTYALWISALVTLVLAASGVAQLWLIQRETRTAVEAQQALEANRASARIDRFMREAGTLLRASLSLLDSGHIGEVDADVQVELLRLMRQAPAIDELYWIDPHGTERVRVSRMGSDRVGTGEDRSGLPEFLNARADAPWFGPVTYTGNQPRVVMARRGWREHSGVLAANLDLAQLRNIIDDTRFGREGHAYLVDGEGHLLAHPEFLQVLARPDWTARPAVQAAIADDSADPGDLVEFDTPEGESVVAYFTKLSVPGWRLITEQPRDEAFAPVYRALATALLILVLAVLAGSAVGTVLARRVVHPIQQLAEGADRIGEGRLEHRIELARGDELGHLATRFNQMAERLGDSYRQLETRVAERTRQLAAANALLHARRDEAEQASQAKTRFLASASHDLRQPLHTISLLVGVLRRQAVTPEVGQLVNHIQASVAAMEALFVGLLDISKLDAGMARPVPGDHDLAELLRRVAASHGPEAARKGLRLSVVPSRCAVHTDAVLLERVLGNLVSNAIRYTQHGKVLVGCRRRPGGIELQVWDTGIGIAPAQLAHVFDEFYQIDNPERDRGKGLGLGLAIVKRTLDLLGHRYALRSAPGRGTCFSILLPTAEALPRVPAQPEALAARPRIAGAFVVVIDDEADTRRAMQALCHSWGAHVLTAASAEQCLTLLDEHLRDPDLILSDYRLREHQDGLAAVRQVRAHIGQPVPAIIITGDTATADLRRVTDAGLPLLHKPVGADRLLAAIEAELGAHPTGGCEVVETQSDSDHEDSAGR
ncbi:MAG: HAMP domain-containing protein [Proteobacteria bacterium]|uniref:hybrid sensor histidine kinase/response regulator n=1 Tax=Ottowia sp. TaxID=1898956 RepID=UPI001DECC905|nr:ATP-binding protein [Ottowia sp.]MBS0403199.1 HAMP domain-containing protein [Pseudomonadota bacterium]MBS0415014.1 HAMP domain-containing protein [Pseudomonadota bacterium]